MTTPIAPAAPQIPCSTSFNHISLAVGRVVRLIRKELRESLRDRRTVITLVMMPLLVYPLLSLAFRQYLITGMRTVPRSEYLVGFPNSVDATIFLHYLHLAELVEEPDPDEAKRLQEARDGDLPLPVRIPVLRPVPAPEAEKALRAGLIDLSVRLRREGPVNLQPDRELALDCEVTYLENSAQSLHALEYVERRLAAANAGFLFDKLRHNGSSQRPNPVQAIRFALTTTHTADGISVAAIVPLILILMTITGAVYPAIDLTAGERERGTLEILVASPISRLELLCAKYAAVLSVAMLTASINLGMMTLSLLGSGLGSLVFGEKGLTIGLAAEVFGLLALFAAFFSAVLLAVTSVARSFKEAQAYLVPLMLLALAPGMLSILPEMKLTGVLAVVPLINIVLLARDLIEGTASTGLGAVVIVSTPLYALAALALASRLFGAEAVLYNDQGTWTELFRRPTVERATPPPSGVLLCLALLLPGYFLTAGFLAQLSELSLNSRFVLLGLATALLFVGLPVAVAAFSRVRFRSGFLLCWPVWPAWPAAFLLGISLWPLAQGLILGLRELGLATPPAAQTERIVALLRQWRDLSPAALIFSLGLMPAICEEFFFRGYVFSVLRERTNGWVTVLVSAGLFGMFHLVFADMLGLERFLTSTLLGLVLGWVCVRTGSVFPGMVLHAVHNCTLVTAAIVSRPSTQATGWHEGTSAGFPPAGYVIALVGVGAGFLILWAATRRPTRTRQSVPGADPVHQ